MKQSDIFMDVPGLAQLIADADHIDVKCVTGSCSLATFIAGMFSYYPGWIKNLYRLRWIFVRLLGLKQHGIPKAMNLTAADVAMTLGENMAFLTVNMAMRD